MFSAIAEVLYKAKFPIVYPTLQLRNRKGQLLAYRKTDFVVLHGDALHIEWKITIT